MKYKTFILHLFDGQSAACAYSLNFNVINISNIVIIIDNIVRSVVFLISLWTFYCSLSVSVN